MVNRVPVQSEITFETLTFLALDECARLAGGADALDELMRGLLRICRGHTGVPDITIWLLNFDAEEATFFPFLMMSEQRVDARDPGIGALGRIPMLRREISADTSLAGWLTLIGDSGEIVFPMWCGEQLLGWWILGRRADGSVINESQQLFVSHLVYHAGLGVDRLQAKRVFQQINAERERTLLDMEALKDLNHALFDTLDLKNVCHVLLRTLTGHFTAESGAVYLLDTDMQGRLLYRFIAQVGLEPDRLPQTLEVDIGSESVFQQFRYIIDPAKRMFPWLKKMGEESSAVLIPLGKASPMIGLVCLGPRAIGGTYSQNQLELAALLVGETVSPIRNSMYNQALKEKNRMLEVANQSLKKAIRRRQDAEDRLKQVYKMEAIGTLASGIAHDFNNILTGIFGYTQVAIGKLPETNPARKDLERVMQAGQRASDLIRQILTFSRQSEQEKSPVRIQVVCDEALKLMRATLPSTIDMHIHLAAEKETVFANPTQIHQVLMNLCTNAAHAMTEHGGLLKVRLERVMLDAAFFESFPVDRLPGAYVCLLVSDTGCGMAPDLLEQIFDPFFTTKELGLGTGMGLAVTLGIVDSHDGLIDVSSTPEGGTVFRVYFPIQNPLETGESSSDLPKGLAGTEHLLFVDDELSIVELVEAMLLPLGYRITTLTSSPDALDLFRQNPKAFDMVIVDQTMPIMTGIQLYQEMVAVDPKVVFLICSGFADEKLVSSIQALKLPECLPKPFTQESLAGQIRNCLDARHSVDL